MADCAAKIEVRSDDEAEREEIANYDEVQDYLANGTYPKGSLARQPLAGADARDYPKGATRAVKGVIRKRAKKFQLVYGGILHYMYILKTTSPSGLRLRYASAHKGGQSCC